MDCRTARIQLDFLPDPAQRAVEGRLADHLEDCPDCLATLRHRQRIDDAIRRTLLNVPIPSGLESRLLDSLPLADQLAPGADRRGARGLEFGRRRTVLAVLGLALAVGLSWSLHVWTSPLRYANLQQLVAAKFLHDDPQSFERLAAFDQSFPVDPGNSEISRLQLSEVRGLDLNGDARQDVAVVRFSLRQSSGVIVVLPTSRSRGVPLMRRPQLLVGDTSFHWQSPDGQRTFLCFVHRGSPREVADHLFGSWT